MRGTTDSPLARSGTRVIGQSVSAPLLTAEGLQVYSSMPPGDANNYEMLKTALLQRYELTEDGFRRKFREK